MSPKRGHYPQLQRHEEKKKEHKSEDGKLSPTCTLISALAQVIVGIFKECQRGPLAWEEEGSSLAMLLAPCYMPNAVKFPEA